ncbi:MAG: reverse transcriptase family protein [Cytophagales bacterium]|nr:reverse transcriptase family protein [Cytophagales bacterium]
MKTFERILKEELLFRTSNLLDSRQHGFLRAKSCSTNMVTFTDSVVLSINDCKTMSTDVVYFDFSKAFDSVNHDLILFKLKNFFRIDGRLLKLIKNYLCGREQCVVIENCKSSNKPVLSGVPQGSILGPILFVLFINDLPLGLSEGTDLALYADDTKIWRSITSENDHRILQTDIDYLNEWAIHNKMNFHPKKCKVVSICNRESPLGMLPFVIFHYLLGESVLSYVDCEKDLGVHINASFNFNEHCEHLLSKASQQLGLVRRTCHFVKDIRRRRVLYLTLVRSQFEHCSPVWRPNGKTMLDRFEKFQKKCIKWILNEEELSYESHGVYVRKCRQIGILPLSQRFVLNELIFFHKIVYGIVPINIPNYLTLFSGNSRLRSSHLDELSYVSSIIPNSSDANKLKKSFFYRTHMTWNSIPLEIRELGSLTEFRSKLEAHLWSSLLSQGMIGEGEHELSDREMT